MGDTPAKRHRKWVQLVQDAVKADGWGQVLEAVEAYEKAAGVILQDLPDMEFNDDQQDIVEKVVVTMNLRTTCLTAIDGNPRPNKDDMELLVDVLEGVTRRTPRVFPLDLAEFEQRNEAEAEEEDSPVKPKRQSSKKGASFKEAEHRSFSSSSGKGKTLVITIQKIGLKDVDRYIDPQIVVTVADKNMTTLEEKQETSIATLRNPPYILFETSVAVQTSLDVLREKEATIFLEFVHYKKSKRKKSCRCWTMLEMDEVKPGPLALELYTKPCDLSKTNINLFTVKPLYLHVDLRLESL